MSEPENIFIYKPGAIKRGDKPANMHTFLEKVIDGKVKLKHDIPKPIRVIDMDFD